MTYVDHNGNLLTQFEWDGGTRPNDKVNKSRRLQVSKGLATVVPADMFDRRASIFHHVKRG